MSDLVTRVADAVGIDAALAEKAIGMMLGFLQREAADGPVAKMIEAIPGASDLVAKYNGEGEGKGLLGSLMSAIGGGGVMGLGQQLMSQGLGMGEITGLAGVSGNRCSVIGYRRSGSRKRSHRCRLRRRCVSGRCRC